MNSTKSKNSTMRSKASKKPTVTNQDNKSRPSKAEVPSHNVTKSQLKSGNKDDEHNTSNNNISKDEAQVLKQGLLEPKKETEQSDIVPPPKENEPLNEVHNEPNKEEKKVEEVKRMFHFEKVTTYWKNQGPGTEGQKYIDQKFPPITESLLDKKMKTDGVDKINIHEVDWKKSTEIFNPNEITLFPVKDIPSEGEGQQSSEPAPLEINFNENKGVLFDNYTHFFHAISILLSYPHLINQIFKTKTVSKEGCYELYIFANGEYKIVVIDDYFPIIKGTNSLRFAKPNKAELWLMLLEKAYAKVHGGYASLLSCDVISVLRCFTGFACERLNFFDIDLEDLENAIHTNKSNNKLFVTPKESSSSVGLIKGKTYELVDLYDVKTKDNEGNEKDLKMVKIKNMFEYDKYKGEYSTESTLWNEDIKRVVNYNSEEKQCIYMSLDNLYSYCDRLEIFHIMFNCNTKLIKIANNDKDNENIQIPQCFNLYLPSTSKVSFSLVMKAKELIIETTQYEQDLTTYIRQTPSTICISKYDPDMKTFKNFEGCFNSNDNCEFAREYEEGYYVIWTYLSYDNCKTPKPDEYYLKVSSEVNFKLRLQCADYKYHLINELVYRAIMQYQGIHMKPNEIYTMNDSYYNYTGLGLKIISNPFEDCYQKWVFQPDMNNMMLLYPYTKLAQFEIEVKPKGYFLILAIKIDNTIPCKFNLKNFFKTFKYNPDNSKQTVAQPQFNFVEFCSKDIKEEEITFTYYDFLNDDNVNILSKQFTPDKLVLEYLEKTYPEQMKRLNDLPDLPDINQSELKYIEQQLIDGTYIGQVTTKDNLRQGKGALLMKENNNTFIGYWFNDKKHNKGMLYDKDFTLLSDCFYEEGVMKGKGMKILEDGTKYEGNFDNDKIHGEGVYYFKDGTKWEGHSENGVRSGVGKMIDAEGNEKEVEYKDGNIVTNAEGQ